MQLRPIFTPAPIIAPAQMRVPSPISAFCPMTAIGSIAPQLNGFEKPGPQAALPGKLAAVEHADDLMREPIRDQGMRGATRHRHALEAGQNHCRHVWATMAVLFHGDILAVLRTGYLSFWQPAVMQYFRFGPYARRSGRLGKDPLQSRAGRVLRPCFDRGFCVMFTTIPGRPRRRDAKRHVPASRKNRISAG